MSQTNNNYFISIGNYGHYIHYVIASKIFFQDESRNCYQNLRASRYLLSIYGEFANWHMPYFLLFKLLSIGMYYLPVFPGHKTPKDWPAKVCMFIVTREIISDSFIDSAIVSQVQTQRTVCPTAHVHPAPPTAANGGYCD